jgi:hypothetical protein
MNVVKAALCGAAIVVCASALPAHASSVSDLDVISASNIGSGNLGTVTLTQNGADEVDVAVTLATDTAFVDTGGPHNAFAFNLSIAGATVAVTDPTGKIFSVGGGGSNTPYGSFTNVIDCPGCGPGASHANPGPLDFTVTDLSGISISDFIANGLGYFFSADVIGPAGQTGDIAANSLSPTPLPDSLPLFVSGLAGLGLLIWRKRRQGCIRCCLSDEPSDPEEAAARRLFSWALRRRLSVCCAPNKRAGGGLAWSAQIK